VSTLSKRNIDIALKAKQWGTPTGVGMKRVKPGDRVVFYVSKGPDSGYWGRATVTSKSFVSHTLVWPDDDYPYRFKLAPEPTGRVRSVRSEDVMARLGTRRLTFLRQAGVIQLTKAEYQAIAELLSSTPAPS
jgi:predicted RNA-binding protein with PUA-like domain